MPILGTIINNEQRTMACNNSGKFALGLIIGGIIGAAAAYFSDKEKRERFGDDFSSTVDRTRDRLVEGYYEARDRYQQYRSRLSSETEQLIADVSQELDDLD